MAELVSAFMAGMACGAGILAIAFAIAS